MMTKILGWIALALTSILCAFGSASAQDCGCAMQPNNSLRMQCQMQCERNATLRQSLDQMQQAQENEQKLFAQMRKSDWYGALAMSPTHDIVASYLNESIAQARTQALNACKQRSPSGTCSVVREFKNQCIALTFGEGADSLELRMGSESASLEETAQTAMNACGQKYSQCKIVLQGCATAEAAIARYKEEQRAEAKPVLDWMAKVLEQAWGKSGDYKLNDVIDSSPLIRQRIWPVAGWSAQALVLNSPFPDKDGPSLRPGDPNLHKILIDGIPNQEFLICDYQPTGSGAKMTRTYAFWYKKAPENIEDLMAIDVTNSLGRVGNKAFSECPAVHGKALAASQDAINYTNGPRVASIRKPYQASYREKVLERGSEQDRLNEISRRLSSECDRLAKEMHRSHSGPEYDMRDKELEFDAFFNGCKRNERNFVDPNGPVTVDHAIQCQQLEQQVENMPKRYTPSQREKVLNSYKAVCRG